MTPLQFSSTPPLFFILSFWVGTALLVGGLLWLRDTKNGKYDGTTLKRVSHIWMIRGFVLTILTSLLLAIDPQGGGTIAALWPEAALLFIITLYFGITYPHNAPETKMSVTRAILIEMFQLAFLAIIIIFVWLLSYMIGIAIMYGSIALINSSLGALLPMNPVRDAMMVVGLLWVMPFWLLYNKSQKLAEQENIPVPEHFRFHQILWPILVALFIFMIPLLIETVMHSDKFKKMMNPPQILRQI